MTSGLRNALFITAGVVGLGGTVALTAVGTYKTTVKIQKRKTELNVEKLPRDELMRIIFPNFAVPLAVGLATGGIIIAAGLKATVTERSIASGAEMIKKTYRDYREKGVELFGKEQDKKILTEIAKDKLTETDDVTIRAQTFDGLSTIYPEDYTEDEGEMLFHIDFYDRGKDGFEGVYFTSTVPKVMNAFYHFNRNIALCAPDADCQASLLSFLGIEPTKESWNLTYEYLWNDNIPWIDFDIGKKTNVGDNMVCRPITISWDPVPCELVDEWGNVKQP